MTETSIVIFALAITVAVFVLMLRIIGLGNQVKDLEEAVEILKKGQG